MTDVELWQQADALWEATPDGEQYTVEQRLWWQTGFVAASKLFIERMEHRGKTPREIRIALGMDA